jgi:hypothetical protein
MIQFMGKTFSWLLVLAIFVSSCSEKEDTPVGNLELTIKGRFGQSPLVMGQEYDFFDGSKIYFTRSEFFLSRIKLRTPSGKIVSLSSNVRFVNLQDHHFNVENAEKGLTLIFDKIEAGNYDRFSFGIGVPPELNTKTPKDFPTTNPLSDGIHYWSGWNSYIFSKPKEVFPTGHSMSCLPTTVGSTTHMKSNILIKILSSRRARPQSWSWNSIIRHFLATFPTILIFIRIR